MCIDGTVDFACGHQKVRDREVAHWLVTAAADQAATIVGWAA